MPKLMTKTAVAILGQLLLLPLGHRHHVDALKADVPIGFSSCLFYDEFKSASGAVDRSKWQFDLGHGYPNGGPANWGTGEIQSYTNSVANVRVTPGGALQIIPRRSISGSPGGINTWTSGRVVTQPAHDFRCLPGQVLRVEARVKLGANPPARQLGIWPAFWILGSTYRGRYSTWPAVGEVDVLETANGLDWLAHTVHCGTTPGGVCHENGGIGAVSGGVSRGEWHTVAWEVDRRRRDRGRGRGSGLERMVWSIDGVERWVMTEGEQIKSPDAWLALVENPKMVLLNVAVGGAFPNQAAGGIATPTNATLDGEGSGMEVDYVAVWVT